MASFKEEYDKRLRRLCGVSDDTLKVKEDSQIIYGGYCNTCAYEDIYIRIRVFSANNSTVIKERLFSDIGEMVRALDAIDPREL